MMKIQLFKNMLFVLMLVAIVACNDEKLEDITEEETTDQSLKEKAAFGIGAAVSTSALADEQYAAALTGSYSQITAEYEMKMASIWSSPSYTWSKADQLVDFAEENDLAVHGHTLLWYRSFPSWFTSAGYDSAEFENKIKEFITTTVSRYKGRVASWDVANEIFNNNGSLRIDDVVYPMFSDPIAFYGRCFQYARDADPSCKLFYNDYDMALFGSKRNAAMEMAERFKAEGYPIDGIGDQSHYTVSTNPATIREGILDMASTGLLIHVSELDIRVNVDKSDTYYFSTSQQQLQADTYQTIVEIFEEIPQEQKFAISTWGVTDKITWLTDWWHPKEYPLLFDDKYNKKTAYEGFLQGLN